MARRNRRGLELSFKRVGKASRGRWYTAIGGRARYFGWGNGITDHNSYVAALAEFRKFQVTKADEQMREERGPEPTSYGGMTWAQINDGHRKWKEAMYAAASAAGSGGGETTVGKLLDDYLEDQKRRNNARHFTERQRAEGKKIDEPARQNIGDATLHSIRRDAALFREVVGDHGWDGTDKMAGVVLGKWRAHCEKLLFSEKIGANTFNDRIKLGRRFVGWAEVNHKLDRLPRAVKQLCGKYDYSPTAKALPVDVLKSLWNAAAIREKCFIALALNCGYYSKDISDLTTDMILGDYIAHRRQKTGVQVKYKLWEVTKRLLERVRSDDGRVFSVGGHPLNWYPPHGKFRVDIVGRMFKKLCNHCKMSGYSFSNLRDTSTTAIENHDKSLTDLFDCHADARMARYYIDKDHVDTAPLDRAIEHLEKLYDLKWDGQEIQKSKGGRKARKPRPILKADQVA
jgi:hypothetical protein